jgi:hypothetical protein
VVAIAAPVALNKTAGRAEQVARISLGALGIIWRRRLLALPAFFLLKCAA